MSTVATTATVATPETGAATSNGSEETKDSKDQEQTDDESMETKTNTKTKKTTKKRTSSRTRKVAKKATKKATKKVTEKVGRFPVVSVSVGGDDLVEIKQVNEEKGLGVFAVKPLNPNTRFPYTGKSISLEEGKALRERAEKGEKEVAAYIVATCETDKELDGNPSEQTTPVVATRINEPDVKTMANCTLLCNKQGTFIVTCDYIEPGTELTCHYGKTFYRHGYKAGRGSTQGLGRRIRVRSSSQD